MTEPVRPPRDEHDDVAVLMRVAGKRRAVPRARFDRVRDAAHAEWRAVAGRGGAVRAKRRRVWIAASAAALVLLALTLAIRLVPSGLQSTVAADASARVAAIRGQVWAEATHVRRSLAAGDAVAVGAAIGTEAEGRLGMTLASGHTVRLDRDTRVRLLDAGAIALDAGAVYVDSGARHVGTTAISVHTPLGVVRESGTQFEVRLADDAVRVRLREGAVELRHGDRTDAIAAGGELRLAADGTITRGTIAAHDPAWSWLLDLATVPPLAGRTARDFLDWAARERGLALAFADETVARSADAIVLGGTASGLTVDEALDAVLPTCRLTWRIDDGVLTIAADRSD
jgi:ferric-dicitrate binding protein FerR (iron transport regulator)